MVEGERWKPILGYEGLYSVSTYGRVRSEDRLVGGRGGSLRHIRERILKPGVVKGYCIVRLARNKTKTVHSLVLEAFVGQRPPKADADHINNITNDNRLQNLRWVTHAQNCRRARKPPGNASEYRGVWFDRRWNAFRARISVNNTLLFLGHYPDERQAALAYNRAAMKYHGKFATLNKI